MSGHGLGCERKAAAACALQDRDTTPPFKKENTVFDAIHSAIKAAFDSRSSLTIRHPQSDRATNWSDFAGKRFRNLKVVKSRGLGSCDSNVTVIVDSIISLVDIRGEIVLIARRGSWLVRVPLVELPYYLIASR